MIQSRPIPRKSKQGIEKMRQSCKAASIVLQKISEGIKAGVSTIELDKIARRAIEELGGTPSFLGYKLPRHPPYPAAICASINEQVVHGIPDGRKLVDGDIISIDVGIFLDGYHGDNAFTFPIGQISDEVQHLLDITQAALYKGIEEAKSGNKLGDVCHAIQSYVESNGCSVVRDLVGHGIGRSMHEEPQIPNYGRPGSGPRLKPGMTLAIEPMVNAGTWDVKLLENSWTVVTADNSPSAHFEHTVAILSDGPEILTWNEELWG
ncbi:TPA: type I methionyl aminopeptidase [Candidatus Poribacteria bacterium]|nr:type I methionyl aminopeptidase [Candidatus Poribacteria bacterium]